MIILKNCKCSAPDNRLCWLYCNDERSHSTITVQSSNLPGVIEQATTFVKAASKFAAGGFKRVSLEVLEERKAICLQCEHYVTGRCAKCGCYIKAKASWQSEECPIGKWKKTE